MPDETGDGTPIYELANFEWSAPEVRHFDPPFQVPPGGGFRFECAWNNTTGETVRCGESALAEIS